MELIKEFIDLFLHLDKNLLKLFSEYGTLTYLILFAIIFIETGFVIMPFLPGDSLLFAAGAFASTGSLNISVLFLLLASAAIAGDNVNYAVGNFMAPKIFSGKKIKFLNHEHLERTHKFYEKHGGLTIIIARFFPIIRTFSPFVAGLGRMTYRKFLPFDILGGFSWVSIFLFGGYFFGNLPFVKNNFSIVIIAIILISAVPALVGFIKSRRAAK